MSNEELSDLPAVVGVAVAAEVLGLSRTTAYGLIRTGQWPTPIYRVGKQIRIPSAPMLALLCLDARQRPEVRPQVSAAAR